ncbi:MAG: phosphoribosylanthranilate isomerase [Edaphobacter sp.]
MWIKICANTNLDDAQLAAELGADAVGFVFAPSMRRVTAAEVARITPHLPEGVERVGVFPALAAEEIANAADEAGLNAVQLHGGVNLALLRQLHDIFDDRVKLIQTVHWRVNGDSASAADVARHLQVVAAEGLVDRVLIDSSIGSATGGTGVSFNWNDARSTLAESTAGLKLIVAGGLRHDNVAWAIQCLTPWGVDVASGVEESPGKKSHERLAAFIQAARNANANIR